MVLENWGEGDEVERKGRRDRESPRPQKRLSSAEEVQVQQGRRVRTMRTPAWYTDIAGSPGPRDLVPGTSSSSGANQPGPAPKHLEVGEVKEEITKEVKETVEKKGVGEEVCALEKDIKITKKMKETQDAMLAAIQEDSRKMTQKKKKANAELQEILRETAEIRKTEKRLKASESELKEKMKENTEKLAVKNEQLRKVLEETAMEVAGPSTSEAGTLTPEGRHTVG